MTDYFIERVATDKQLARHLEDWKQLRRAGWDVTVLLAPDQRTVIALGYSPAPSSVRTKLMAELA